MNNRKIYESIMYGIPGQIKKALNENTKSFPSYIQLAKIPTEDIVKAYENIYITEDELYQTYFLGHGTTNDIIENLIEFARDHNLYKLVDLTKRTLYNI